jgi:hypothetical protein
MATNSYQDADWREQLGMFQKERNLGQTELARALQQSNLYKAQGDNDAYNRAQTWVGQINTAMGNPTDQKSMMDSTQQNLYQNVNAAPFQFKPPEQFKFDMNTDPQYQSALQGALKNATVAQGNAMSDLNRRGLSPSSSMAVDRANQIQQRAVGDVQTNILPQLIQQAFQRYQDSANRDYQTQAANYNAGQDQIGNQSALSTQLNNFNQQGLDNAYRDQTFGEQKKQNNWGAYLDSVNLTGDLGTGAKEDYSLLGGRSGNLSLQGQQVEYQKARDLISDEENKLRFDEDVRRFGLDYALRSAEQANVFANRAADNARAAESSQLAKEKFEFDKEQASATKPASSNQIESEAVTNLDQMAPDEQSAFFQGEAANIINEIGITGYNRLYNRYFDQDGKPIKKSK